jgi:DNA ligase-1
MPKSTKAAPPQQASLQEMWGKKKEPKVASKPEPDAMEVDVLVDKVEPDIESSSSVTAETSAVKAESSKRKESVAEVSSMFLSLYVCCDTIDMP